MGSTTGFFDEPQGAALFKHTIYGGYVPVWARKVGSRSVGHRLNIFDGFAGAGAYLDGSPGSPMLALEIAASLEEARDLRCFFVERDAAVLQRLAATVAASPAATRATVLHGEVAEHLDTVLAQVAGEPLFAFLDPFGLGIPFDDLVGKLLRRRGPGGARVSTEVLMTFVHAGVYRNAGKLELASEDPAQVANAEAVITNINDNLGGPWWQDIWRAGGRVHDRVAKIRAEYVRRILGAAGPAWRCYQAPVADTWKGKPIYDLLFLTQHPQGVWYFNEAVSSALKTFKERMAPNELLVPQLWEPKDEWQAEIAKNLRRLLAAGRPVHLIDHVGDLYGTTLGHARGTHVRAAIKGLHAAGHTPTDGKGDPLWDLLVQPSARESTG